MGVETVEVSTVTLKRLVGCATLLTRMDDVPVYSADTRAIEEAEEVLGR